jgi:hypothetical protein
MKPIFKFLIVLLIGCLFFNCSANDDDPIEVTAEVESFIFTPKTDSTGIKYGFTIKLHNPNNVGVKGYCVVNERITPNNSTGVDVYDSAFIYNDFCSQIEANTDCLYSYLYEGAIGDPDYQENIEILSTHYVIESTY